MVCCFRIWVLFNSAPSFSPPFCPAMVSWAMRTFLGRFLPEESFWGEVRTGAPVHTVRPQELFGQSGFHVGHRPRGECSPLAVGLQWPWSPYLSLPSPLAAWQRLRSPLWGEVPSKSEVQCVIACGNSRLGLFVQSVNSSSREAPTPPLDL